MIEIVQKFFTGIFQGPKKDGHGDFSTSIDPNIEEIFLVKFKIDPRAAIGNDASIVEDLSPGMGFDLILIKKDARRTMELADDHPFCPIDNECPIFSH
jgi:hypothetical protein